MTIIKDKQALIDEFNDLGNIDIDLSDEETIQIEQCIDYIVAERVIFNAIEEYWELEEYYGAFENIEVFLEMLEEKEVLTFEK